MGHGGCIAGMTSMCSTSWSHVGPDPPMARPLLHGSTTAFAHVEPSSQGAARRNSSKPPMSFRPLLTGVPEMAHRCVASSWRASAAAWLGRSTIWASSITTRHHFSLVNGVGATCTQPQTSYSSICASTITTISAWSMAFGQPALSSDPVLSGVIFNAFETLHHAV